MNTAIVGVLILLVVFAVAAWLTWRGVSVEDLMSDSWLDQRRKDEEEEESCLTVEVETGLEQELDGASKIDPRIGDSSVEPEGEDNEEGEQEALDRFYEDDRRSKKG